jgi:predicted O-methyltransferase YrrM
MEQNLKDYKMEEIFNITDIESSYTENNIGKTIFDTVLELKPNKVIEFGCLYGYSTVAIGLALKQLGQGQLICYDLWEDYKYKHSTIQQTISNVTKYNVQDYVKFIKMDFNDWIKNPESFDLMHLDISNTGDTILQAYNSLPEGSVVMFEGGSVERDNIEWMIKYNTTPINSIKNKVNYKVINPEFPSLSIFKK